MLAVRQLRHQVHEKSEAYVLQYVPWDINIDALLIQSHTYIHTHI